APRAEELQLERGHLVAYEQGVPHDQRPEAQQRRSLEFDRRGALTVAPEAQLAMAVEARTRDRSGERIRDEHAAARPDTPGQTVDREPAHARAVHLDRAASLERVQREAAAVDGDAPAPLRRIGSAGGELRQRQRLGFDVEAITGGGITQVQGSGDVYGASIRRQAGGERHRLERAGGGDRAAEEAPELRLRREGGEGRE